VRSLITYSAQRALGLRRPATSKVLPILAVFIAYVPAIVIVGITALFEELVFTQPDLLPPYSDYYGYITAAIVLFTAFVAPEVLCADRRDGMLGLYLSSPLTRNTYLLAKGAAVMAVLGLVTLGPPLFLLLARTIAGTGPEGPAAVVELLWKIVVAGIVIAGLQASLSLAVASTTTRRAAASAGIILLLIGSSAVSGALSDTGDAPDAVFLVNLFALPFELVRRIYGDPTLEPVTELSTGVLVAAYLGWTALFAVLTWARYRRLQVTR
jgi:ABC-2 type transport system permease protein